MRCPAVAVGRRRRAARSVEPQPAEPLRAIVALVWVVGLLSAGGSVAALSSTGVAAAAPTAGCGAHAGVLVVVDFSHFGGGLVHGCSPRGAGGLDAMHEAGFVTAGDESDGTAFVCRIGVAGSGDASERPTPADDACVVTPPADAYWSFWYADAGDDAWSYSPEGVDTFRPAVGSVEAWEFGSGRPPPKTPSQVRAAGAGRGAAESRETSAGGFPSRSVASAPSGGGSPAGFVAAAAAVVALCALAAAAARRRQRAGRA